MTTADGLPESTGQALVEDSLGYIWIGTQSGLVRYDGSSMLTFKANYEDSSALQSNQIEGLLIDSRNTLWISTRKGLSTYLPQTNSFRRIALPSNCTYKGAEWFQPQIYEDSKGQIWAFNFWGALRIERDLSTEFIPFPSPTRQIISTTEHLGNQLFSQNNRLYTLDDSLRLVDTISALITHLYSNNHELIACTADGLWKTEEINEEWHQNPYTRGVFTLGHYIDGNQREWTTSVAGILLHHPDGKIQQFQHIADNPTSLSQSLALSFLEDSRGWIWVGTGDGINIYNPELPRMVHAEFLENWQLPKEPVEVLAIDEKDRLWIGMANQLIRVSPNSSSEYPYEDGLVKIYESDHFTSGEFNIDFLYPEGDTLWMGTNDGTLFRLNTVTEKTDVFPAPGRLDRLRGIARTEGGLALGYALGTRLFSREKITEAPAEWQNPFVVQMVKVADGSIWMGSPEHLIHQSENRLERYPSGLADSLPDGTMLTAALQSGSTTWLATFGTGILEFRDGHFRTHNQLSGYPDDNVWSVYEDRNFLWSSTDKGIVSYQISNQKASLLSKEQGIYSSDFIMSAHAQSSNGTLFFGHPEGLLILYPQAYTQQKSTVQISQLDVNYSIAPNSFQEYLSTHVITLHPGESNITLHLAKSDFGDNPLERIEWKWSDDSHFIELPENQYQLSFTNLKPGTRSLILRTSQGQTTEVNFEVIPPFYKTTWFRSLVILALLFLTASVVYSYNRWKYMKQIRFLETERKLQSERERISKDLHDYVGAHLTRITTDLDLHILRRPDLSEDDLESLQSTRDFTKSTVHLLRDTIWAINEETFTVGEFANRVEVFLQSYLGDFVQWKVTTHCEIEGTLGPNDALNLLRIIQEATQNMLKYSDAEHFNIHLESTSEVVRFTIEDDGNGMDCTSSPESSFGLDNMKERAEQIGGTCEITSQPGKGVQIEITLKQKQADRP